MPNNYLENRIRRSYRFLSETEKKAADYLLEIQNNLVTKTIANLADETGVSQATIFKLVKKLGFDGFQDFKINIAANSSSTISNPSLIAYNDITSSDTSYEIAMKVINSNLAAIQNLVPQINKKKLDHILEMVYESRTIHFFGIGGSSVVAFDSYQKFVRTNFRCNYIMDFHLQLMYTTKFTSDDVVFLFSHSGQSIETLNLAKAVAKSGAKLIVLTGNPHSEMAHLADEALTIYSEESKYRTESLASRILYLTMMDTIYVNLMLHDETKGKESMKRIRSVLTVSKTDSDYIL